MSRTKSTCAGDVLLHPIVLGALALLAFNDHFAKARWPGFLTGKLSDVAGLVLCPLVLAAMVDIAYATAAHRRHRSAWPIRVGTLAVGLGFAVVQLIPVAGDLYRHGLGALQMGIGIGSGSVMLTPDPTDLFTLPALGLPWRIGKPSS